MRTGSTSVEIVNPERISACARRVGEINRSINSDFSRMKSDIDMLARSWQGRAGSQASNEIYKILDGNSTRSDVLQNYVNALNQMIVPGYHNVENANKSLAEAFK